jgi:hypothetical protein
VFDSMRLVYVPQTSLRGGEQNPRVPRTVDFPRAALKPQMVVRGSVSGKDGGCDVSTFRAAGFRLPVLACVRPPDVTFRRPAFFLRVAFRFVGIASPRKILRFLPI